MIWVIRHIPRREPKFHQAEMLGGVGRSIRELLIIFRMGWFFRRLGVIKVSLYIDRIIMKVERAKDPRYVLISPV